MSICSTYKVSQTSNFQNSNNNSQPITLTKHENEDHRIGLGRVLEDLDKCIERKSKLREENYLELCLQTEIGSIISNIMNPQQEMKKMQGKESEYHVDKTVISNEENLETHYTNQIESNLVKHIPKKTENRNLESDQRRERTTSHKETYVKPDKHNGVTHRFKRNVNQTNIEIDESHGVKTKHSKINLTESIGKYDKLNNTNVNSKHGSVNKMTSFDNSTVEGFKSELNIDINNQTINNDDSIENHSTDNTYLNESNGKDNERKEDTSLRTGKSLKFLLENIRNMFGLMKTHAGNEGGITGNFKTNHNNVKEIDVEQDKMTISKQTKEEIPITRMAKTLESTFEMMKESFQYQVLTYLNKLLEYSRTIKNDGKEGPFLNVLRTGFTMVTRGRGKKDHKGAVLSSLIILGILVPIAFSAVTLMAKKALISSLVALALSIYGLNQHTKGAIQGKQSYEVEGPVAQPFQPPKYLYGESKYNTPSSPGSDLSNAPSMPYSFPIDDTKYFNNRPTKQHSPEETTSYKHVTPHKDNNDDIRTQRGKDSSKGNYHNYEQTQTPKNMNTKRKLLEDLQLQKKNM
ncbi:hypothetical protein WDU94_002081 [Cyamophila willieti]